MHTHSMSKGLSDPEATLFGRFPSVFRNRSTHKKHPLKWGGQQMGTVNSKMFTAANEINGCRNNPN